MSVPGTSTAVLLSPNKNRLKHIHCSFLEEKRGAFMCAWWCRPIHDVRDVQGHRGLLYCSALRLFVRCMTPNNTPAPSFRCTSTSTPCCLLCTYLLLSAELNIIFVLLYIDLSGRVPVLAAQHLPHAERRDKPKHAGAHLFFSFPCFPCLA